MSLSFPRKMNVLTHGLFHLNICNSMINVSSQHITTTFLTLVDTHYTSILWVMNPGRVFFSLQVGDTNKNKTCLRSYVGVGKKMTGNGMIPTHI